MKRLQDVDVAGKHVVARVDFDDPLASDGTLMSDFRMRASLPTIEYLRSHGAKQLILVSKLGRPVVRPKERVDTIAKGNPRLTMQLVAHHLRSLLGKTADELRTTHIEDFPLPAYVIDKNLYLLENIRFDWRESGNDDTLARELASLGDIYVFDAFAVAHRAESSTVGIAKHTELVAGLRLQEEVAALQKLTHEIKHPFVAVMGGAKTETKLPVIEQLMDSVDTFLLGGVIANTFAVAAGQDLKRSVVDTRQLELVTRLYKRDPSRFVLPTDYLWQMGKTMDVGEKTRAEFRDVLSKAKTIFWNGTLGVTSMTAQDFKYGSLDAARAIAANRDATTIVSGGDTVGLLEEQKLDLGQYSFVSTGGGATLEFLAGQPLPALEALEKE